MTPIEPPTSPPKPADPAAARRQDFAQRCLLLRAGLRALWDELDERELGPALFDALDRSLSIDGYLHAATGAMAALRELARSADPAFTAGWSDAEIPALEPPVPGETRDPYANATDADLDRIAAALETAGVAADYETIRGWSREQVRQACEWAEANGGSGGALPVPSFLR